MNNEIILKEKDNYKIVAISDIHGHLQLFEKMIETLNLKDEDILIILGDFINKGPDNIAMVKKMMEISQRKNTYVLSGNHEYFIMRYISQAVEKGENYFSDEDFLGYLKEKHFVTLLHEMCQELSIDLQKVKTFKHLKTLLIPEYNNLFSFMNQLPILLHIDDMIFVHAGYNKSFDVNKSPIAYLKYDDFVRLSDIQDKQVIVGHWPTSNLRHNKNSNEPHFDEEKNIVSIDGGLGVKSTGELNALIIEKRNGIKTYSFKQENHFKKVIVSQTYDFPKEQKSFVNYPNFDLELIDQGPVMSKCLHVHSGNELSILNDVLDFREGKPNVVTTYINHFIHVHEGDEVEYVKAYKNSVQVKHNCEFGWVLRHQLDHEG
jgi:protein phosphatase